MIHHIYHPLGVKRMVFKNRTPGKQLVIFLFVNLKNKNNFFKKIRKKTSK